jgi:acetylornithine deacetylase/succinyl-diaminopimelate desuccinylase-like protein
VAARALEHARRHRARFVRELQAFVRIPSVSVEPARAPDVKRCAAWLAAHLQRIGLSEVCVTRTARHDIVTGAWLDAPGRPTVLIYGHYDVQPVDPARAWTRPPFSGAIEQGAIHGRGACDDKGQLFAHLKAIESYLQASGRLPVNVKCLFEGEEEINGPSLQPFVRRHRRWLAADAAVVSDTPMLGPGRPAISYAERGALRLELEVRSAASDLHSGNFGGAVHNAAQALSEIIAGLHDANGHIAIPGFYDQVRRVSRAERAHLAKVGLSGGEIVRNAGSLRTWGEKEFTPYERIVARPALTVNGIEAGYHGPGVKTVIPASARAKLSFRLVPDQDPPCIDALFRRHVARVTPPTVRVRVRTISSAKPALMSPSHPAMRAAGSAYTKAFGVPPVFIRSGGSIPVVNTFEEVLGIPTVLMGFASPDDRIHAPNEKFSLATFDKAVATSIWFLSAMAKMEGVRWSSTATATREPAIC